MIKILYASSYKGSFADAFIAADEFTTQHGHGPVGEYFVLGTHVGYYVVIYE
jgi:hypothetical protein